MPDLLARITNESAVCHGKPTIGKLRYLAEMLYLELEDLRAVRVWKKRSENSQGELAL